MVKDYQLRPGHGLSRVFPVIGDLSCALGDQLPDELPAFGKENIAPHVGILTPMDDGSARFLDEPVTVEAYAVDRDGKIQRVDFYADDRLIESDDAAPFEFTWTDAPPG